MEFDQVSSIIVTALGSSVVASVVTNVYNNWHEAKRENKKHQRELEKIRFQRKQEVGESLVGRLSAQQMSYRYLKNNLVIQKNSEGVNIELLNKITNSGLRIFQDVEKHFLYLSNVADYYFTFDSSLLNSLENEITRISSELAHISELEPGSIDKVNAMVKYNDLIEFMDKYDEECNRIVGIIKNETFTCLSSKIH